MIIKGTEHIYRLTLTTQFYQYVAWIYGARVTYTSYIFNQSFIPHLRIALLHTARYKFCLLTYLLTFIHSDPMDYSHGLYLFKGIISFVSYETIETIGCL
jgi:hypothetical protein